MFIPCKNRVGSAYYEFQYCREEMSPDKALEAYGFWAKDSLLVHADFDNIFFDGYIKYLEPTYAPDGSGRFYAYGVNYYDKEMTQRIIDRIKEDKPTCHELLLQWLEGAGYGFYFLGL